MKRGALVCKTIGPTYTNIAHESIQDARAGFRVPCGPGGTLHDYVPFYFAPRSPMLCAIHNDRVPNYSGGQTPILHLVTSARRVIEQQLPFVFTDGHGTMKISNYYTAWSENRHEIDWPLMASRYWADTQDDPDRKRRRQAEFLVLRQVPMTLLETIGVKNGVIAAQVRQLLRVHHLSIEITVNSSWYY